MNERIEKTKERVAKIKNHIKRNGKVYITGGACLVIGAAAMAAYMILHGDAVRDDEIRRTERDHWLRATFDNEEEAVRKYLMPGYHYTPDDFDESLTYEEDLKRIFEKHNQ